MSLARKAVGSKVMAGGTVAGSKDGYMHGEPPISHL